MRWSSAFRLPGGTDQQHQTALDGMNQHCGGTSPPDPSTLKRELQRVGANVGVQPLGCRVAPTGNSNNLTIPFTGRWIDFRADCR
jgi:hypothetical protein